MKERLLESWLVLSYLPGMRPQLFNALLEQFTSPQAILTCKTSELVARGVKAELCTVIKGWQNNSRIKQKVEESLIWQEQAQCQIVTRECKNFPILLKQIPDPPPLLYIKGELSNVALPQIAMVGSRKPSPSGRKSARFFARELGGFGLSICSGMAVGIDYESHMGALERNNPTIAVLGSGIDCLYPKQHRALFQRIVEQGAIISEFPLGTPPNAWNFPQRNRVVSGLSLGVLVVEAALRSGSLISARFALEQGREVFAMPGSIHNPMTAGCHYLINNGAKLVASAENVIEELGALYAFLTMTEKAKSTKNKLSKFSQKNLSAKAKLLLSEVGYEPVTSDSLLTSTGLGIAEMNSLLTELELKGRINCESGGYTLSIP